MSQRFPLPRRRAPLPSRLNPAGVEARQSWSAYYRYLCDTPLVVWHYPQSRESFGARAAPMSVFRNLPLILTGMGVTILGYCFFVQAEVQLFQWREMQEVQHVAYVTPGLVGRITIARLNLSVAIGEGADDAVLRRAVGHIAGTALPGQGGNVGLAGHRDTFFRPLRNIRLADTIILTTERGDFRYRVVSTKVVDPHAVEVLGPTRKEILTLVTCYPFYFVGKAPRRFIVRADRIRGEP